MPDYSKIQIYRLVCKNMEVKECYIGSTTNWTKRKQLHKRCCNTETDKAYNQKKYVFIRANGGWSEWEMVLIEAFPCENSLEARKRERYWAEQFASGLNAIKAYVSEEERKEYEKKYKIEHADKIKEQHREYNKKYHTEHAEEKKEYNKEYHTKNAEQLKEKMKENYKKHAEQISEKGKEKITCECSAVIRKGEKTRHFKSKKHIQFIQNI